MGVAAYGNGGTNHDHVGFGHQDLFSLGIKKEVLGRRCFLPLSMGSFRPFTKFSDRLPFRKFLFIEYKNYNC